MKVKKLRTNSNNPHQQQGEKEKQESKENLCTWKVTR
jgi:hypothetical protein